MDQQPPLQPQTPQPSSNQSSSNIEFLGRLRLGLLVVGILVLTIIGKYCGNKKGVSSTPGQGIKLVDHGVPVVSHPVLGRKQKQAQPVDTFVPPEGSITITPKDPTKSIDDLVKIHYQEMGFTFEPGIEFSGNLYFSYGVDAKLFYFYRLGVGAGVVAGSNVTTILCPDLFISYRLDQIHLRNTEAVVTYVPTGKIPFGIGLRINI